MGKSLITSPRGTFKWLLHMGADGPLDPDTPQSVSMGDGSDTPLSFTTTKAFLNGSEIETVTGAASQIAALLTMLESEPIDEGGSISGTLTPDATGDFSRIEDIGGYAAFASAGRATSTYPYQLITYTGAALLLRHYVSAGVYASWLSAALSEEDALDPSNATGWTPSFAIGTSVATGTPVVDYHPGTQGLIAGYGERGFVNIRSLRNPKWKEITFI